MQGPGGPLLESTIAPFPENLVDSARCREETQAGRAQLDWWFPQIGNRNRTMKTYRGGKTVTFRGERIKDHEAARVICSECPVRVRCGQWAKKQPPTLDGIWNGLDGRDREYLRRQLQRRRQQAS